jgi:hypothetical protein
LQFLSVPCSRPNFFVLNSFFFAELTMVPATIWIIQIGVVPIRRWSVFYRHNMLTVIKKLIETD